ncbi:M23 family metallopeptidase [Roseburia sp. 1XD42-69]|uniref:M23 family metallopeptidase n=1 Tax=Roseburia sp. 1XD42-69 TaxID=2320088 RepID=UPI001FAA583E|nr:M23 family metallopeptidase [Roseburia sp. 1XD42-69]
MRRDMRDFFRKKQYTIAAACVAAALLGAAGIYAFSGKGSTPEEPKEQTAQIETEEKKIETAKNTEKDTEEKKETKSASAVIKPARNNQQEKFDWEEEEKEELPQIAQADTEVTPEEESAEEPEETVETTANVNSARELHFSADTGLSWPVSGAVILNYSMDKTVYFSTLDQYKYNPAIIIAGNVNEKVQAAASGTITDISTNEVTGCTVTMDLGDGYQAVYGQLKEVPYKAGAYVEAGNTIGFVNEPTKYYSLEGSNLYFELLKDGTPVDPVEYFSAE